MEANEDGSLADLEVLQRNASSQSLPRSDVPSDTVRRRRQRLFFNVHMRLGHYILLVRYDRSPERRSMEPPTALRAFGHHYVSFTIMCDYACR